MVFLLPPLTYDYIISHILKKVNSAVLVHNLCNIKIVLLNNYRLFLAEAKNESWRVGVSFGVCYNWGKMDMAEQSFFFYDLETSGLNPRESRIMQFAGRRTDMELNPVGEPVNLLIKLTNETLPSPSAIMVTGITPQATQADGLTEAEFAKYVQ